MASIIEPQSIEPPGVRVPAFPYPGTRFDLGPGQESGSDAGQPLGVSPVAAMWFALLCLGVFGIVAGVYLASMTSNLSVEGDNAIYMILAKAIANGHGYMNIQGPVPRVEAQYPFVFPLMLVPIVHFYGVDGVLQMQALVTACALAAFALGFFLFRTWLRSGLLAFAVMLATAESDLVWSFAHKVLTEIPYLFFSLVACFCATQYARDDRWRTWACLLTVLAAGTAFLTRTIGVSLCAAIPLYMLFAPPLKLRGGDWKLRFQKAVAVSLGIGILAGGWTLRNRIVYSGQGHNYIGQFFLKQAYVPDQGSVSSNGLVQRIADNASYYAVQFQRMVGGHYWDRIPEQSGLSQVLLAVALIGFVYALFRQRTVADFYIVGYVAIVLLWPWQDLRFAVPVMPFLFYYLATAISLPILALFRSRSINAQIVAALLLIPLTLPTGIHTFHQAQIDRAAGYHYQLDKLGEWEAYPDWRDFHAAALWLKRNAVPGSTVINRSPNLFYLWTGLASRNYPYTFDTGSVMQDISREKIDYVVLDDFTWTYTTSIYLKPTIKRFANRFLPLQKFHGTTVYEIVPNIASVPTVRRSGSR